MFTEAYVYLLSNKQNNIMYTGITTNLPRRIYEHKNKLIQGFTQKFRVDRLVYYEACTNILSAIEREKQIKSWSRKKKNILINTINPQKQDLYPLLMDVNQG